ncbi:MAG: hypothetical protein AABX82_00240 [Nanoarchaeota archaeon]
MKPTTLTAAILLTGAALYTPKAEGLVMWGESHPGVNCYDGSTNGIPGETLHDVANKLANGPQHDIYGVRELEWRLASWNDIPFESGEFQYHGQTLVVPDQRAVLSSYFLFPFVKNCPINNYGRSVQADKPIVHVFSVHER